jgi:hypothetical protein
MRKFYLSFLRGCLCVFCTSFLFNCAIGQVQTPRYISITSNTHGFYEYLPQGYSTAKKYPLLVCLAGTGELGNGVSDLPSLMHNGLPLLIANGQFPTSFTVNGQTFSFIVISPQFESQATPTDMDAVFAYAKANYSVDPDRLYLTGLSLGGNTVWNYVSGVQQAAMLAAIVPIAGGELFESYGPLVIELENLPVFAAANLNDPTVPSSYTIENVNNINAIVPHINPTALDTIYNASGHEGWTTTYNPANAMHNGLNIYQWMLQYSRGSSTVLPIKLVSFTAQLTDGAPPVQLAWATSFEQNNDYFLVQRSSDGQSFSNIDSVPAATDAENGHSYTAVDANPLAGKDYYRLAQVNLDGTFTYSGIDEVTITQGQQGLRVSPNPADQSVVAELRNKGTGTFQLRLTDVEGRTLRIWTFQKQDQYWSQALDIGNFAVGSYFLQAIGSNFKEVTPLIRK